MSLGAETLRAMAAMGLTIEQAAEIAEAMLVDARPKDQTAAARQQLRRDRVKAERDASRRDVTRDAPPIEVILTPSEVSPGEPNGSSPRSKFPAPSGVTAEQWSDFLTVRRTKRAGRMTETAYSRLCSKLDALAEDGWPPGEMVSLAVERGWTSVFPPRDFSNERSDADPTSVAVQRLTGSLGAHN